MQLKLAVFYLKHRTRCQQEGDLVNTSNDELESLKQQYKLEMNWKITNPDTDLKPMAFEEGRPRLPLNWLRPFCADSGGALEFLSLMSCTMRLNQKMQTMMLGEGMKTAPI